MHALGMGAEVLQVGLFRALGQISSHPEREKCVRAIIREAGGRDEFGYSINVISW